MPNMKALKRGDSVEIPNVGTFTVSRWLSKQGLYWKLRLVDQSGNFLILKVASKSTRPTDIP